MTVRLIGIQLRINEEELKVKTILNVQHLVTDHISDPARTIDPVCV